MFCQRISNLLNPKSLLIVVAFPVFGFNSFIKCDNDIIDKNLHKNLNKKYIERVEKYKNIKIGDDTKYIRNYYDPKNDLYIENYNIIERNKPNIVVYNILDDGFILNIKYLSDYLSDYKHSITQEEYDQYKAYLKRMYSLCYYPLDHYLLKYKMKKDLNIPMKYPYSYYLKVNKAFNKYKKIPGNTCNTSKPTIKADRNYYYDEENIEDVVDDDFVKVYYNLEKYIDRRKKILEFYKK